ncbi:DUF6221 family protein [Streptomyces qinzhouensis]|uniref:Uncharacterized protein n=1 Tax=Streptomyces qinzhouensis TaxID=2599401 RepID=A0A5B8JT26_9ACTN|nr:DUF6221 family protein [Streptomyces qinzhouensis]QDY81023.1 hypothetical protein FQU76_14265 [Streptomyces qinzhouensis]
MRTRLTAFLLARLDEDADLARRCDGGDGCGEWAAQGETVDFCQSELSGFPPVIARHVARHDPARTLRETEAGYRILTRHTLAPGARPLCRHDGNRWPCPDLRDLAARYTGHPDFPGW